MRPATGFVRDPIIYQVQCLGKFIIRTICLFTLDATNLWLQVIAAYQDPSSFSS